VSPSGRDGLTRRRVFNPQELAQPRWLLEPVETLHVERREQKRQTNRI
jgi:hypothetical protein